MVRKILRAVIDTQKFIMPTGLYMRYYAKKHDDEYKRLMDEVGAPEYYKSPEVKRDYFKSLAQYGFPVKYYKELGFYEIKDGKIRDSFVAPVKLVAMWHSVNDGPSKEFLDNKVAFLETFSEFLERDWIYVQRVTYQEFKAFCEKHPKMIVKKSGGSRGKDIHTFIYENVSDESLKEMYEQYKAEDFLVEEYINQTGILHELNPGSVNCVRISTMRFKDHIEVFQCFLKMGIGDTCVDNVCQGGIFAPIDVNTGVVTRIPSNIKWKEYETHPISNKEVMGIEIPDWENVKELAIKAAEKVKDVVYVSWDIAVSEDGKLYLIEGNSCGGGRWLKDGGEWSVFKRAIRNHHKVLRYKFTYNYFIKMRIRNIMANMEI